MSKCSSMFFFRLKIFDIKPVSVLKSLGFCKRIRKARSNSKLDIFFFPFPLC